MSENGMNTSNEKLVQEIEEKYRHERCAHYYCGRAYIVALRELARRVRQECAEQIVKHYRLDHAEVAAVLLEKGEAQPQATIQCSRPDCLSTFRNEADRISHELHFGHSVIFTVTAHLCPFCGTTNHEVKHGA